MACLLKIPSKTSKGVLVFSTFERSNVIFKNKRLYKKIEALKSNWVIVLHPNYYDHDYQHDPLFDVVFNVVDMLQSQQPFPQLTVQIHSFTPSIFKPSNDTKFWDIIHVTRAQTSKNVPEFFDVIRALYDRGKMYRVFMICTIPDKNALRGDIVYDIRKYYDQLFSEPEKDLFTLLTTSYRQPYPFDLPTIAHFYRSSKVLLNSGGGERQGRINAYAWCTGMPVVSLDRMKDLIPHHLRKAPVFYPGETYDDLPDQVIKAIEYCDTKHNLEDFKEMYDHCSETHNTTVLKKELAPYYSANSEVAPDQLFNTDLLDRRLARHFGFGDTTTSINVTLETFVDYISNATQENLTELIQNDDPERALQHNDDIKKGINPEYSSLKSKTYRFARATAMKYYKKYILKTRI